MVINEDRIEANLFATSVYGTVLVARQGSTSIKDLQKAQSDLSAFGGKILGSVFNAH